MKSHPKNPPQSRGFHTSQGGKQTMDTASKPMKQGGKSADRFVKKQPRGKVEKNK